jgi:predicted Ser/Thr protein kinase
VPGIHDDDADDLTIAATRAVTRSPGSLSSSSTPSSIPFAPGAIIAGRYRLVSLLGRGGMGEVYRADDLTLDQTVALKFLPADVANNSDRLAQFHAELRIARQVSHKNVCRLYDLGEHEGRRFLTMEYIDGEDLATLLRRIGRLPQDKAIEIARQLCAGIAAAHDRGVLHRDLKPANVMIDGEGNVRITDFGLAVAAGDATAVRAGTPQYMAPEQLGGGAATVRSDIYALGLVLFEMFTGKRAFEAKTFNELLSLHASRTLANPSSMVRDLDPAIERIILRCLEHDPALRPGSALAVAAALPGGDPLAAALAAGETPSPEMIAAAGETSAFSPAMGLSLVAAIIVGVLAFAAVADHTLFLAKIPTEKTADALEDRARETMATLGYRDRPADTARGFLVLQDYIFYVLRTDHSLRRWDALSNPYFPSLRFWYRTSPRPLETFGSEWRASLGDPPMTVSNMASVVLDMEGHLTQFTTVTPQVDEQQDASPPVNWKSLFDAAGLDPDTFKPVESQWVPNSYADERRAWEGQMPGRPDITLRVEAAAYRGRPAFFQIVGPWTRRPREAPQGQQGAGVLRFGLFLIFFTVAIGTCVLARYNFRTGRGDRRGATRIAAVMLAVMFVSWVLGARHWLEPLTEGGHFLDNFAAEQLELAAMLWLSYLALEPYVRRYSPGILMSWSRLLSGRVRDPRVGRDILVGIVAGIVVALVACGIALVPSLFGAAPPPPRAVNAGLDFLLSTRRGLSQLFRMPINALFNGMFATLAFALARIIVKRTWLAAVIAGAVFAFLYISQAGTEQIAVNIGYAVVMAAVYFLVLVYFGMFANMVAFLTYFILYQGGLTADLSKTYAPTSTWLMVLVVALAAFGFYASRGGEPLFGKLSEA